MTPSRPLRRAAGSWLRARILVTLSSGSVAAGALSAGGCGGEVGGSATDDTGAGGSASGTGGTSGKGVGGVGGVGFGGTGGVGFGGTAIDAGTGAVGGSSGDAGAGAFGGSIGAGGAPNCSAPDRCMTCPELLTEFSHHLDGFSCDPAFACPDLIGAWTGYCQNICTPPFRKGDLCCYGITPTSPACGRPFTVGEELRTAPVVPRTDWMAHDLGATVTLDTELRRALENEWQEDARLEHASIASFARLTLELLALGAPAELVRASQQASLDEIEHARLCFALAGRFAGSPRGPGQLAINGALTPNPDLAVLAEETVLEGCVGETLAALLAAEQLEAARDPEARAALRRIAADEARHAELSWRILRWAVTTGGARVQRAAEAAFERVLSAFESGPVPSELDSEARVAAWHAHGRLLPSERAAVLRAGLEDVVRPCASALFG